MTDSSITENENCEVDWKGVMTDSLCPLHVMGAVLSPWKSVLAVCFISEMSSVFTI